MPQKKRRITKKIRQNYAKIPKMLKLQFLMDVINSKQRIKQVAKQYQIKYTTALTLVQNYRKDPFDLTLQNLEKVNLYAVNPNFHGITQARKQMKLLRHSSYRLISQPREVRVEHKDEKQFQSQSLNKRKMVDDYQKLVKYEYEFRKPIQIISRIQFIEEDQQQKEKQSSK